MLTRLVRMRFTALCLVALLLGGVLRVQAGWPGGLVAAGPAQSSPGPAPAGLSDAVLNFYHFVDKGRYSEAYDLAYENRWQPAADGTPAVVGLTTRDDFVAELSDELGADGMGLNIVSIDVVQAAPLPAAGQVYTRFPDLWALRHLPAGDAVDAIYQVQVTGTLLGRCSRWDWHRLVLVMRLKGGHGWKVLLPGKPTPSSPHNEEWFLERKS